MLQLPNKNKVSTRKAQKTDFALGIQKEVRCLAWEKMPIEEDWGFIGNLKNE